MRRAPVMAALAVCAAAPVLWTASAAADPYPPTGPTGGGGTTTVTGGGGTTTLPRTGQDLVTPVDVGAALLLSGVGLIVAGQARRPAAARRWS